ncbi:UPF0175 family protein [Thiofilum flexile]|uniref:UPF0175 family protein n=1 Tax=Thiofilum flexile TaxID=125627 RepID=UPI00039A89AF|nr:UPF0175 family protein [Thiofilum flexile]
MYVTNVRDLPPSLALRQAKEAPVLILKGNEPDALLFHLERYLSETIAQIRLTHAASLFRDGLISLGKAARISSLPRADFILHLDELGIDVVRHDETVEQSVQSVYWH